MTILFSNYSPKIPKSDFFGHKFRHFCFSVKFCKQTNLRVLISNITMVFLKFLPKNTQRRHFLVKNTQIRHFWSQIQAFLFFREILQSHKFEGADFKYHNIVFKFQPKITQIRCFWSQIQAFLFFPEILQIDNFEGADFKYDNSFFKNSCPKISNIFGQKYPNKVLLVPNLGIFVSSKKLAVTLVRRY